MVYAEQDAKISGINCAINWTQSDKMGRLWWLGNFFRMQGLDSGRKLTVLKVEGTRRAGKPKLRWLGSAEEDLRKKGVRKWRRE
jgi:hypothetical protein